MAGREWYETLYSILIQLGWKPAPMVPALWKYTELDNDCNLSTVVDDLLFTELRGDSITQRTITAINGAINDKMKVQKWPKRNTRATASTTSPCTSKASRTQRSS